MVSEVMRWEKELLKWSQTLWGGDTSHGNYLSYRTEKGDVKMV